jgi:hypothetical protein
MWIHKEIFTDIYFALITLIVSQLEDNEGKTSNGKYFKLKSQNIWNIYRINSKTNDKFPIVSLITNDNLTSYWIYYRLLTNYDSDNHKDVDGSYQNIDGFYIASALKFLGYVVPEFYERQMHHRLKLFEKIQEQDEVEGEILLNVFVFKKRRRRIFAEKHLLKPNKACLANFIFDDSEKQFDYQTTVGHWRTKVIRYDHIYPESVYNFVVDYLHNITLSRFDEAYSFWGQHGKKKYWDEKLDTFILYYSLILNFEFILILDLEIDIQNEFFIHAKITVSVIETLIRSLTPEQYRFAGWPFNRAEYKMKLKHVIDKIPVDVLLEYGNECYRLLFFLKLEGEKRERAKFDYYRNKFEKKNKEITFTLNYNYSQKKWSIAKMEFL